MQKFDETLNKQFTKKSVSWRLPKKTKLHLSYFSSIHNWIRLIDTGIQRFPVAKYSRELNALASE